LEHFRMSDYIDQTGRTISIQSPPKRIISLVPSQTELLYSLGLNEEVVGITKFCIHPTEWFHTKTRIGGTKMLNMEAIHELQPDLIIANKEENVKEQVEELAAKYPVWISDVNDPVSAYDMIAALGAICGKEDKSAALIDQVKNNFAALPALVRTKESRSACYLIWRGPYMTIGGDTFIHKMLAIAGFDNIYKSATRYPEISIDELRKSNCKYLLLSSEPYPFRQKHIEEFQLQLPRTTILLVDGEMFSWYGSRMLHAAAYFLQLRKLAKL
jgi:ABC-type Fe3+-hydroxamate transport system substrate-binding protein